MSEDIKEIQDHLQVDPDQISLEPIIDPEASPLNQPVAENQIGLKAGSSGPGMPRGDEHQAPTPDLESDMPPPDLNAYDAPEQELGQSSKAQTVSGTQPAFEVPDEVAQMTADTYLNMADYGLEISGGFLVKVRKRKEFHDYDEIIDVIDEHNERNIEQFKLSKNEKAMVRPVLIQVIKRSGKSMTPENQLLAHCVALLSKRVTSGFEMRAANKVLEERILDIVRKSNGDEDEDGNEDEPEDKQKTGATLSKSEKETGRENEKTPAETVEPEIELVEEDS